MGSKIKIKEKALELQKQIKKYKERKKRLYNADLEALEIIRRIDSRKKEKKETPLVFVTRKERTLSQLLERFTNEI